MQAKAQQRVITIEEAANRLQTTAAQILGLIEADVLSSVELDGKWWVPEEEVEAHNAVHSCQADCVGRTFCRSEVPT